MPYGMGSYQQAQRGGPRVLEICRCITSRLGASALDSLKEKIVDSYM